ncbi:MAG: hypothetical protein JWM86_2679 [Thermoleophilia bacterium]|nr:hypothetical protein [Thermoleophilia bacterium]
MQLVSPRPGSLGAASTYLGKAQGFAANVSNDPTHAPLQNLTDGVKFAKLAAAELFLAEPRSEFQDLVLARQLVIEGQGLLEQAIKVQTTQFGSHQPAQVKQLAHDAFNVFEDVFEIIQND